MPSTGLLRWIDVEPSAESVAVVRGFVAEVCAQWHLNATSDVAVLLASELATNAVRHARTPVTVWLARRPDRLVLSVEDSSTAQTARRSVDDLDDSGRGLQIVDALAERWGQKEVPAGKLVWAEIRTSG